MWCGESGGRVVNFRHDVSGYGIDLERFSDQFASVRVSESLERGGADGVKHAACCIDTMLGRGEFKLIVVSHFSDVASSFGVGSGFELGFGNFEHNDLLLRWNSHLVG